MKRIDANTLGRFGYNLLKEKNILVDKDKQELTFEELKMIHKVLKDIIKNNLDQLKDDNKYDDKNIFSLVFYSSILAFVNNTDLNKYINYSTTETEE